MALEPDQVFALDGEGVFIQLVEVEDAVGDLDDEFGVFGVGVEAEVMPTTIDNGIGDLGFYVVEPVVFRLMMSTSLWMRGVSGGAGSLTRAANSL